MSAEISGSIRRKKLIYEEESFLIRGACFALYSKFYNSQKESVYMLALIEELKLKGLAVEKEKKLPIFHLGKKVGVYIPDIIVENKIIIELKAKPFLHPNDIKQFWFYLKNSDFPLGFLINFGETEGVKIVRRVYDEARQRSSASRSA